MCQVDIALGKMRRKVFFLHSCITLEEEEYEKYTIRWSKKTNNTLSGA